MGFDKTYGASSQFVRLAVRVLIVLGLAVSHHGHDIWERGTRAIILVSIKEDSQSLKFVYMSEDLATLRALFGKPHGHTITIEVMGTLDGKFDFDLCREAALAGSSLFQGERLVRLARNVQGEARL